MASYWILTTHFRGPQNIFSILRVCAGAMNTRSGVRRRRVSRVEASSSPSTVAASSPDKRSSSSPSSSSWLLSRVMCVHAVCSSVAALYVAPPDCDEVFNYWEPLHYLLYGSGLQTWEYSPVYGLRSYLYIGLHAIPGAILAQISSKLYLPISSKMLVFYGIRVLLCIWSAKCHHRLFQALSSFSANKSASIFSALLAFSPGMMVASMSFLPQSFAMNCITLSFAAWMEDRPFWAIFYMAAAGLIGWPFVVLLALPMALHLALKYPLFRLVKAAVLSAALCLVPSFLADIYYYRRPVLAIASIVLYNAFTSHGADLYGVEEWHFYARNLVLNVGLVFPLSLAAVPLSIFQRSSTRKSSIKRPSILMYLGPALLFVAAFTAMKHKEERFLFPIYPLLTALAGVSLSHFPRRLSALLCLAFTLISASRLGAIIVAYSTPLSVYAKLPSTAVNVCIGKEWYRYPSSFFLESSDSQLLFLKSGFGGLLPKPFARDGGTWRVPTHMNDLNQPEPDRFVADLSVCDYIVDLDLEHQIEPHYAQDPVWSVIDQHSFLDASTSPTLARAFFVPFWSIQKCTYRPYQLLKRRHLAEDRQ